MNFSDGLQVPEGPGGAEGHHVVLYLRNCLLWNRFCDDLNLAIQNVPKQKKQKTACLLGKLSYQYMCLSVSLTCWSVVTNYCELIVIAFTVSLSRLKEDRM